MLVRRWLFHGTRLLLVLAVAYNAALARVDDNTWLSRDDGELAIHLYFFWSATCPHCERARPFVTGLTRIRPWLHVHEYELSADSGNVAWFMELAASVGAETLSVPAFVFCNTMVMGFDDEHGIGAQLARMLEQCRRSAVRAAHGDGPPTPLTAPEDTIEIPLVGTLDARAVALPLLTVLIAGVDAFNPCAFFVLLFLLSLLVHARSPRRMLVIGGTFVLFSGLVYFLFMAAWLNVFLMLGELRWVTRMAGAAAVVIAAINIKDYFWFHRGVSLSIPEAAKPGLFKRMRQLAIASGPTSMLLGTVVLALAANSYELLCTAGFPMVYTRALTLHELSTGQYYAYLVLYNIVYIVPLAVIVIGFTATLGARRLSEQQGRVLKLVSGLMMLGLGLVLLIAPALLSNVAVATGIVAAALASTAIVAGVHHRIAAHPR